MKLDIVKIPPTIMRQQTLNFSHAIHFFEGRLYAQ